MDCLLHLTATLCLLSPTQLAVRADVSTQLSGQMAYFSGTRNYHGGLVGHLSIDMPLLSTSRFAITAGYMHESLLDTRSDRGEERATLGFAWRPL